LRFGWFNVSLRHDAPGPENCTKIPPAPGEWRQPAGATDGIDRLPGNEHGDDGGFASSDGEPECEAEQSGLAGSLAALPAF